MKNHVHVISTKFNVDKVNKVVVCELSCDLQLEKTVGITFIDSDIWQKTFPKVSFNGMFKVTAKARCYSTDTFDETKGKRIAESRAKAKMYKIATGVWSKIEESYYRLARECSNVKTACSVMTSLEDKHVKELEKA